MADSIREVISVEGIIKAAKNPDIRVYATRQGAYVGEKKLVGGDSVAWKGAVGLEAVRNINPKVGAGLSNAIRVSKNHTEDGEVIVKQPNGKWKYMPRKAAMMQLETGDITAKGIRGVPTLTSPRKLERARRARETGPVRRERETEIPFEGGTAGYPGEIRM